ncbi:asparagine synthase-related protein [Chloroflexota bacterium]
MSGFAVSYGQPDRKKVEQMFKKIEHRGPHLSGIWAQNRVMMAQNYLQADLAPGENSHQIPVADARNSNLRICLDGQIGNGRELAQAHHLADGPFSEARLLLHLYQQHGHEMFQHLDEAIFAFVISDGTDFFAARDLLGIKTLFYGRQNGTLYLASELKSILAVTDQVYEFPPGHYMDSRTRLIPFAELPQTPPEVMQADLAQMIEDIRDIIRCSLRRRVDFFYPTGALLSGGMDSSVIAYLASELYRQKFGQQAQLKTFAIGVGESDDIRSARLMAEHIGTDHYELMVSLEQVLEALPEVIYYLESFDPSLVRSAVSNFLVSRYAKAEGMAVLLSGEGGDEIFGGYAYLKTFPPEELFKRQVECLGFLHNNASLRLDRMNQSHALRVVAPLISGELLRYALRIPPEYKVKPNREQKIEKWIFRKAFADLLPESVTWRFKQEFSQGSGSADLLPAYFEKTMSDEELAQAQEKSPLIRSKEELYYFQIFVEHFGDGLAVDTVGQWLLL